MDELEQRLRGAYDAARAEAPQSGPQVYTAVRAGARRRRTMRASLTAAVAVVALGAVGMGAYGITTMNRAEPALPVITPEPTASASADPTPAPSPSVEPPSSAPQVPEVDPRFDDSADGIAADALPALAADRGVLYESEYETVRYPQAHVMEDWVWDAVGGGWALDVAAMQWTPYEEDFVQPAAVMYLVSPEDVHFELFELPERAWDDVRVTSWREDQGLATLWWVSDDGPDGARAGAGGQLDLRTGELDDLVMSVYGETAWDYRFIMANAEGDELWRAESDAGFKYYRWSEGADEDGWVASALVDDAPQADNASISVGRSGPVVSEDGDSLLLRPADEAGGTVLTLIAYNLSSDTLLVKSVGAVPERAELQDAVFLDATTVEADLYYPQQKAAGYEAWTGERMIYQLDDNAAPAVVVVGEETWPDRGAVRQPLLWGQSSPAAAAMEDCGC